MPAERDLARLLQNTQPTLSEQTYVFCSIAESELARIEAAPLMVFREEEGLTLVLTEGQAVAQRLAFGNERWALITCKIHSDLNAVGFLARTTAALADAAIPANAVSAYFHDHIFVPSSQASFALQILESLTDRR